jgi:AcrR family transcriptional regulator
VGHHGWQGNPPRTEDEARQRIVAATTSCVERLGSTKTTVSEVAAELGVTRQTVYRYYPSHGELLGAVAQAGLDDFVERMVAHLSTFSTPADVAFESIVFALQAIPQEPRIGLLFQAGETEVFGREVTSSMAISVGADILRRIPVDWSDIGVKDDELDGLAEMLMRLFDSFLQYPGNPPASADDIRVLARRWLGPALAATNSRSPDVRLPST